MVKCSPVLSEVIAEAFEAVSLCPEYREKWITSDNLAQIIAHEHDLPETTSLDGRLLRAALKHSLRYSEADGGQNGLFCSAYRPLKNGNKVVTGYFITTERGTPPRYTGHGSWWFQHIVKIPTKCPAKCAISEEKKTLLREALLAETSNKRKSPPQAHVVRGFNGNRKKPPPGATPTAMSHNVSQTGTVTTSPLEGGSGPPDRFNFWDRPQSPVSAACATLRARNSREVIACRAKREPLPWYQKDIEPPSDRRSEARAQNAALKNAYTKARELECILATLSRLDTREASQIVAKMLDRLPVLRELVLEGLEEREVSRDTKIVDNLRAFIAHHPSKGARHNEVQQAIDVVAVAASFGNAVEVPPTHIAQRLGVSRTKGAQARDVAKRMRKTGERYKPAERARRKDAHGADPQGVTVTTVSAVEYESSDNEPRGLPDDDYESDSSDSMPVEAYRLQPYY